MTNQNFRLQQTESLVELSGREHQILIFLFSRCCPDMHWHCTVQLEDMIPNQEPLDKHCPSLTAVREDDHNSGRLQVFEFMLFCLPREHLHMQLNKLSSKRLEYKTVKKLSWKSVLSGRGSLLCAQSHPVPCVPQEAALPQVHPQTLAGHPSRPDQSLQKCYLTKDHATEKTCHWRKNVLQFKVICSFLQLGKKKPK